MRSFRFIVIALIGAVLIAGLVQLQKDPDILLPSAPATPGPAPSPEETPSAKPTSTDHITAAPPGTDLARQFRDSTNLLEFARALQPRALEGDAASRYWLAHTLDYCEMNFEGTFFDDRQKRVLSPEEVLQFWPKTAQRFDLNDLRRLKQRCEALFTHGIDTFGDYQQLLEMATQGGYPMAQMQTAVRNLGRGGVDQRGVQRLAREALRGGDPEVVLVAGHFAMVLHSTADDNLESSSQAAMNWQLAACLRGADCGPQADWVRRFCLLDDACQPFETGVELMRRARPGMFDAAMRRAHEINELIDARRWDEIEFR